MTRVADAVEVALKRLVDAISPERSMLGERARDALTRAENTLRNIIPPECPYCKMRITRVAFNKKFSHELPDGEVRVCLNTA